jgi:DNA repair photolyase
MNIGGIIENLFFNNSDIYKKYGFNEKEVKSIFNKRKGKRNSLFLEDYTLNPYLGCSFNCLHCYINGSKYAKDTESFYVKSNARDLVYKNLKTKFKNKQRALINLGSSSDPYMNIEKDLNLTRDILKTILRFKFPVHIITKSDLILRDIDILEKINNESILPEDLEDKLKSKVIISFSFSTIDDELAKIMEPNAPLPSIRLETIKKLSKYFTVGVAFMPILPYIADNDLELDKAISKFSKYNCQYVLPGALSLFGNNENSSRIKYYKAIEKYFPEYLEDTKKLFWNDRLLVNKDYPSNNYQSSVYKKVVKYCSKYGIKTSII